MNILLTSAGRRTYLVDYFKDVLKNEGLVHASNSEYSSALSKADKQLISPLIYEENYIPFLLEYAVENDISAIFSLFDIDLPVLAKSKEKFKKKGIEIVVSDLEVVEICNDKWKTHQFLLKNGFISPTTFIDLEESILALEKGEINFPLIVKPRWGMGSKGIFIVEDELELNVFYKKTVKEVNLTYMKYESIHDPGRNVIIQEYILGQEYGLDVFNDLKKNYLKTYVKKKIAMRAGETDSAVNISHNGLEKIGNLISQKLGHVGNLDLDCLVLNEKVYILDMNCRFGGGYPFTHLAGANLPKVLIDLLRGKNVDAENLKIKFNEVMVKEIMPMKIN